MREHIRYFWLRIALTESFMVISSQSDRMNRTSMQHVFSIYLTIVLEICIIYLLYLRIVTMRIRILSSIVVHTSRLFPWQLGVCLRFSYRNQSNSSCSIFLYWYYVGVSVVFAPHLNLRDRSRCITLYHDTRCIGLNELCRISRRYKISTWYLSFLTR